MILTVSTSIEVSEANMALIPVVAETYGYSAWVGKITDENNALEEPDPNLDTSHLTFLKQFLVGDYTLRMKNLIAPCIKDYFGGVMKAESDALIENLETSVTGEAVSV